MRLEDEGETLSFLFASCFCQYHLSNTTSFLQGQLFPEAAVVDSRRLQFSDFLNLGEPALLCTFGRVQVWGTPAPYLSPLRRTGSPFPSTPIWSPVPWGPLLSLQALVLSEQLPRLRDLNYRLWDPFFKLLSLNNSNFSLVDPRCSSCMLWVPSL